MLGIHSPQTKHNKNMAKSNGNIDSVSALIAIVSHRPRRQQSAAKIDKTIWAHTGRWKQSHLITTVTLKQWKH